ncbi:PAS domain-containing sensor histidine kinase [Malaciobacter halophilus]|uniref:histidine kinase n=1 Tax=Malaciobacter halophilus TaxID=197482 RepID=A0A2N1J1C4_9BACT|nr:PAS domain S-box protein [Malaciobacter halophilus]AXH08896.1 PAS sensor-containing two-component system histidine kinase [Malaciobacter halophilus]PKI80353.1 PAS domain-containing sensor histidine kinase [Malaciobacter halophilus]
MKIPFYMKIFLAFVLFSSILFALFIFLFKDFYEKELILKQRDSIEKILSYKSNLIDEYTNEINEKLKALHKIIKSKNLKNNNEITRLFSLIMESNKDILSMKYLSLTGKEIARVDFKNEKLKIIESKSLQDSTSRSYFKDIRILKNNQIWYSSFDIYKQKGEIVKPLKYVLRVVLRVDNGFLMVLLDAKSLLFKIQNSYEDSLFVIDKDGYYLIKEEKKLSWSKYFDSNMTIQKDYETYFQDILEKNSVSSNSFVSKRVYLSSKEYIILLFNINELEKKNSLNSFENYVYTIFIVGIGITLLLSLLFAEPIAKLNRKTEQKNRALDMSIKKSSQELQESLNIINKHVIFLKLDKDGIILDVSKAFCEVSGFIKEELLGHHHKILMHPDMSDKKYEEVWSYLKQGKSYIAEFKSMKKDGGFYWVESYIEPVYDSNSNLVGYTSIRNNITDKKLIEYLYDDLNNQVLQYNAIFENANSGIGLIDLKGNFQKVNSMFTKLLGYSNEELLKSSCFDIIKKESKQLLAKIFKEANEIGFISNIEKIFIHKNGHFIHLELSLNLLPNKKSFVVVVSSLEDKRKLQELNQNLEQKIKQEVQKSRYKDKIHQEEQIKNIKLTSIGSLAAGITHEINTPLTYIKGNFEMMGYDIQDLPNSEIKNRMLEDSQKINEGLNRIANIVESMREISQSSSEIKEVTNIYSTLITALTMAYNRSKQVSRIYLNNKEFNIDSINKKEFEFFSKVQKQRVEQVWIVIINNALDELAKIDDYEKRALNIDIYEKNSHIYVEFKDNAGGIDESIIDTIFEPFVSSKEHSGIGVGLNISKRIIEQQNGQIKAYNKGSNAVFEVCLKAVLS